MGEVYSDGRRLETCGSGKVSGRDMPWAWDIEGWLLTPKELPSTKLEAPAALRSDCIMAGCEYG